MNAFNPAERLRQHAHGLIGKRLSAAELMLPSGIGIGHMLLA
jgi:hypothetical protein